MSSERPSDPKSGIFPAPDGGTPRVIESRVLFSGGREVLIRHEGQLYRLRLTRHGKLILTK